MEPAGETAAVRAVVPMAEMLTYEPSLRSMTGGRGGYSMEFSPLRGGPGLPGRQGRQGDEADKEKAEKH